MRFPAGAPAVLAAALLAGCAHGRGFVCPASGGPPWREVASAHFLLRTDLGSSEARELVGQLEVLRAAVAAALLGDHPGPPGRVEVVAFATAREYRDFAPGASRAYYLRYVGAPPRIVLAADLGPRQRTVLAHELAHHLAASVFLRQPRWLSEGLATYVESLGEQGLEGEVVVGRPPMPRLARALADPVPTRELLAWRVGDGGQPELDRYASSWLLVHYLKHRRAEAFSDFEGRLARGEPPDAAWAAAFPEYDPDRGGALEALDRTLQGYARSEAGTHGRAVAPGAPRPLLEQAMAPAEVHALRLALWGQGPPKGPQALRAEVAEALSEDPAHPVALEVRARLEELDPLPLARASVRAYPEDPRAWTFLALSLGGEAHAAEREEAFRVATELAPESPAAHLNLAGELLARGKPGEALPPARRSVRLAPWSPTALEKYAAVLAELGRCGEALEALRRAEDLFSERTREEIRGSVRERAAELEGRCGAVTSPRERGRADQPRTGSPGRPRAGAGAGRRRAARPASRATTRPTTS